MNLRQLGCFLLLEQLDLARQRRLRHMQHVGRPREALHLRDSDCAADKVYEFMFCAPPLPISKAVGSPINPMAIK